VTNNKYIKATKKVNYKMKDDNDDIDYGKSSVCQLFQMMADKRTKKLKGFARTDKYVVPKIEGEEIFYDERTRKKETIVTWSADMVTLKKVYVEMYKEMDDLVDKSKFIRYGNELGSNIKGRLSKDDWK